MNYTTILKAVTEVALIEARTKIELQAIGEAAIAEIHQVASEVRLIKKDK